MFMQKSVIEFLKERKIIANISDEIKINKILKDKKAVYIGFDPSFKSLHLGNYIMIRILNIFNKFGYDTVAIIGGATGRIGDPSGKKQERKLLDLKLVESNISCLKRQLSTLLKGSKIIDNFDFYKDQTVMDFLRDIGKEINLNYLLEKEIIKSRLEIGISFAELTYNLLQGNDFLTLFEKYNVGIQIGGSDQWGNITTGLELIRKKHGIDAPAAGMTINLLTKEDGTKFGKSEKGAIYLDPTISSPFEMYQFLINQADADLEKLFMFFSDLSLDEIKKLLMQHNNAKAKRIGQKALAKEIVTNIHGENAYKACLKIADALFNGSFGKLTKQELDACLKQFNTYDCNISNSNVKLVDFLIQNNIIKSKRIFRDLVNDKALLVNDKKVDENYLLDIKDSYFNTYTIIKKGKKNYFIIHWKENN